MGRGSIAKDLFLKGYNCAQAIVLAFSDCLDVEEDKLEMLASSFGGGLARLREVCGCVSGMAVVMGLLYGRYDKLDNDAKSIHYQRIQKLTLKFKEQVKSYICSELLNIKSGIDSPVPSIRNKQYYHNRACGDYIECMANLIEMEIIENEKN